MAARKPGKPATVKRHKGPSWVEDLFWREYGDVWIKATRTLDEVPPVIQSVAGRRGISGNFWERSHAGGAVLFSWPITTPDGWLADYEKLFGRIVVDLLAPGHSASPEEQHGVSESGWAFKVAFQAAIHADQHYGHAIASGTRHVIGWDPNDGSVAPDVAMLEKIEPWVDVTFADYDPWTGDPGKISSWHAMDA
jgi:hypothetical protein